MFRPEATVLAELRPTHPLSGQGGHITRRPGALADRALEALFDETVAAWSRLAEDPTSGERYDALIVRSPTDSPRERCELPEDRAYPWQ